MGNTYYESASSTLTQKYQATIPLAIRKELDLHKGDKIVFIQSNDDIILRKQHVTQEETYLAALSATMQDWNNAADDAAYNDL